MSSYTLTFFTLEGFPPANQTKVLTAGVSGRRCSFDRVLELVHWEPDDFRDLPSDLTLRDQEEPVEPVEPVELLLTDILGRLDWEYICICIYIYGFLGSPAAWCCLTIRVASLPIVHCSPLTSASGLQGGSGGDSQIMVGNF